MGKHREHREASGKKAGNYPNDLPRQTRPMAKPGSRLRVGPDDGRALSRRHPRAGGADDRARGRSLLRRAQVRHARHPVQHRLRADALEAQAEGQPDHLPGRAHPVPRLRADRGDEPVRGERPQGPRQLRERDALGAHRDHRGRARSRTTSSRRSSSSSASSSAASRSPTRRACASIVEAGPAMTAGVQTNDRILEVNGAAVHDWDELRKAVGAHPGEAVDLTIDRDGRRRCTSR